MAKPSQLHTMAFPRLYAEIPLPHPWPPRPFFNCREKFLNPFTPIYSMTLNLEPSVGCCQTGVAWHEPGPFFASHLYNLLIGVAFIVVLSFLFW